MRPRELPSDPGHDALGGLLLYYELGALSDAERGAFEAHALECDACFDALERGAATAAVMRARRPELARALRTEPARSTWLARLAPRGALPRLVPALAAVLLILFTSTLVIHEREARDVRRLATFTHEKLAVGGLRAPGSHDATDELIETGAGYHDLGNYREAARCFEAALARSPDRTDAAYLLGLARALSGDAAGAIAPLERAARHADAPPALRDRAAWALANAYLALGRRAECESVLTELAARGGDAGARAKELLARVSLP